MRRRRRGITPNFWLRRARRAANRLTRFALLIVDERIQKNSDAALADRVRLKLAGLNESAHLTLIDRQYRRDRFDGRARARRGGRIGRDVRSERHAATRSDFRESFYFGIATKGARRTD